jgi:MFS family permease
VLSNLLINKQYARLWLAGVVSWVGDFIFDTILILWIATILAKGKPWAPTAVSGVLIAVLIPTIVVGPAAGVFVDRWDSRRTMLFADAIRAVLVGGLFVLPLMPRGTIPVAAQLACIYTVVFICSAVSRFFTPARFAVVADIVPADEQAKASAIGQSTMALAGIVGPPLAAPLLFTAGVQWALLANAASFVWSFLLVRSMRLAASDAKEPAARPGFWPEMRAGLRAMLASRVLVAILLTAMICNFGAYLINTLNIFFVTVNLHTTARLFGVLDTAFGIGGVIGGVVAGAVGKRLGLSRTYSFSLLLVGLFFIVYARSTYFVAALGVLLLAAIPLAAMNTVVAPIIMKTVPREMLGRVFALLTPTIQVTGVVAVAVAGWLSSSALRGFHAQLGDLHFGTYDTIFLAAGAFIALSGCYAIAVLRGADVVEAAAAMPDGDAVDALEASAHRQ